MSTRVTVAGDSFATHMLEPSYARPTELVKELSVVVIAAVAGLSNTAPAFVPTHNRVPSKASDRGVGGTETVATTESVSGSIFDTVFEVVLATHTNRPSNAIASGFVPTVMVVFTFDGRCRCVTVFDAELATQRSWPSNAIASGAVPTVCVSTTVLVVGSIAITVLVPLFATHT